MIGLKTIFYGVTMLFCMGTLARRRGSVQVCSVIAMIFFSLLLIKLHWYSSLIMSLCIIEFVSEVAKKDRVQLHKGRVIELREKEVDHKKEERQRKIDSR